MLTNFAIEPVIEVPTREEFYGGKFVASGIDQVNIRASNATVKSVTVTPKLSDHYFVGCQIVASVASQVFTVESRYISSTDEKILNTLAASYDWGNFTRQADQFNACPSFVKVFGYFYSLSKKQLFIRQHRLYFK